MNKILLLLCFAAFMVSGQNISEYYVTNIQPDATLYFIFPFSLFEKKGDGDLKMDFTYKTKNDSATINFTYCQNGMAEADSISFDGPYGHMVYVPKILYIEVRKLPKWEHRYSFQIPFKQLSEFFAPDAPFKINIYSNQKRLTYIPKEKKWAKYTGIIQTILKMSKIASHDQSSDKKGSGGYEE